MDTNGERDQGTESADKTGKMISAENGAAMMEAVKKLMDLMAKAGMDTSTMKAIQLEVGAKCGPDMDAMPMVMLPPAPFGGATSFAQAVQFMAAQKQAGAMEDLTSIFRQLQDNILGNDDLGADEKAAAITELSGEYAARLKDPIEGDPYFNGNKSLTQRLFGLLGWKAAATKTDNGGKTYHAADYADVPDPEKPSTWKLRLSDAPGKPDPVVIADAITAMQPGGFRGQKVEIGSSKSEVVSRIRTAIGKSGADDVQRKNLEERLAKVKSFDLEFGASDAETGGALVFQDKDGAWRWLGIWSNDRKDRESERFPVEAHREFIAWADANKQLPELWGWHTPGSRAGVAEMVDIHEGFTIAAGTFDKGMEDVALRLSKEGPSLGMSHGFVYRPSEKVDGEIRRYRTFEVSYLPREKAANEGTAFVADKEAPMDTTKEQWLRQVYGDQRVDVMKGKIVDFQKSLEGADATVGVKDVIDALLDPAGVKPDQVAAAAAAAAASGDADKAATAGAGPGPGAGGADADAGVKALGEQLAAAVKAAVDPIGVKLDALADVPAQLAELKTVTDEQAIQLAALKEADDAKIAAAFAPRAVRQSAFKSATESKGNEVVDDAEAKRVKDAGGERAPTPVDPYLDMISHAGAAAGG